MSVVTIVTRCAVAVILLWRVSVIVIVTLLDESKEAVCGLGVARGYLKSSEQLHRKCVLSLN